MIEWQPILAVFLSTVGILYTLSRGETKTEKRIDRLEQHIDRFEQHVDAMRLELMTRINRVADDQKNFYSILGEHKGKLEMMEKSNLSAPMPLQPRTFRCV